MSLGNDNFEFEKNIKRLRNGYNVAMENCDTDSTTLYIIINRHIGDAVRTLQVLNSVKEYYGESADRWHFSSGHSQMNPVKKTKLIKKLCVITTQSISGVAKLFSYSYDALIILGKQDLDDLEVYSCSPCAVHKNIVCDENAYRIVYGRWETDEGSWIRATLLGVNDLRWNICLPPTKISGMIVDDDTVQKSEAIIKANNMDIKTSVIICPYAKTTSMLSGRIWENYVASLYKRGFRVFTNVFGQEQPINGTAAFSVDIDVMVYLVKLGYRVIGVQSGLMDVLIHCRLNNITVLSILKTDRDIQFAKNRKALNEVNVVNSITYLRIEHFEEDYVLKLLMDNFH